MGLAFWSRSQNECGQKRTTELLVTRPHNVNNISPLNVFGAPGLTGRKNLHACTSTFCVHDVFVDP